MLPPIFRSGLVVLTCLAFTAPTVRAADLDPYLPADTETYVSIHVRQLLDSSLMKKFGLAPAKDLLKGFDTVNDVLLDLGFDPFKDIDRLIIATPSGKETDRGLFIVHGKFDVVKFAAKANDAAKSNGNIIKAHKVPLGGGVTQAVCEVVVPSQDLSLFITLASDKTLLAAPAKDYIVDALKQVKLKKKPVLKNKGFQALLEKMDAKQTISLAVLGKGLSKAGIVESLPPGGAGHRRERGSDRWRGDHHQRAETGAGRLIEDNGLGPRFAECPGQGNEAGPDRAVAAR